MKQLLLSSDVCYRWKDTARTTLRIAWYGLRGSVKCVTADPAVAQSGIESVQRFDESVDELRYGLERTYDKLAAFDEQETGSGYRSGYVCRLPCLCDQTGPCRNLTCSILCS